MLQGWRTTFLTQAAVVIPLMAADCAWLDFHEATDKLIILAQGEA